MSNPITDPLHELEQELTRLLGERAGALESIVPPIARLVADGESAAKRHRRVRTWSVVGAAAAVLVAVGVPVLATHGSDHAAPTPVPPAVSAPPSAVPTSLADLPQASSGPAWAYVTGDRIHVGPLFNAPFGGGSVLAASSPAGRAPVALWTEPDTDVVYTWRDGRDVPFGTGPDALPAAVLDDGAAQISPDGSTVFSSRPVDDKTVVVTAYDTSDGSVIGTHRAPALPGGDPAWPMLNADDHGRMYLASGDRSEQVSRWDPRSDVVVQVSGVPGPTGFVGPTGLGALPGGHQDYGTVDDAGEWHHLVDLPLEPMTLWSADGSAYLLAARKTQHGLEPAQVIDPASGRAVTLGIPPKTYDRGVAFEEDAGGKPSAVLILAHEDREGSLLRCAVTTGRCERVLDHVGNGAMVFPNGPTMF